ncbi:MAG: hypothetical protein JWP65_1229 [Ramlibacter sp.]|uniref:hypothetical protein n=1 Tax=Ramlibacter sp. TaxID=1917967 RepID=UPI002612EDBD|nr:hypothetical protein [Ramlibacter sp.]MDB5750808.1 hypothetical protein [Ramlibacter sp.]
MTDTVAPEFLRFVEAERRANRLPQAGRTLVEGEVFAPVFIKARPSVELMNVAARRAAGFFRPTKHSEVVWLEGENALAVGITAVDVKLADGLIRVLIPVRCDQSGSAIVEVLFACGSPTEPAGLYAATARRPNGPQLVVAAWGDALVAFAWHCVINLITGIAAAIGKDARGNLLIPVELEVSARGIQILPMARHRFAGSNALKSKVGR